MRLRIFHRVKRFSKRAGYFGLALLMALSGVLIDVFLLHSHKVGATTFTTSGTWTVPAGMLSATFEAWGGGAPGGGETANGLSAGGGAGGSYASKTISVTPGDIYTVTVAAVQAGTVSVGRGNDSFVKNPSSATVVYANGGTSVGSFNPTLGAISDTTGAVGDIILAGGNGGDAVNGVSSGGGGGGAGSTGAGGNASGTTAGTGTSLNGGNGGAGSTASGAGAAGSNYGGGGSGANDISGAANKNGGNGAQGLVVITPSSSPFATIRQEINIIDATLAVSSTSSSIVQLDTTKYSGTVNYYFEVVTGSSSASTDSVTLTQNGTSTNDATVTLAGTAANVRVRSTAFTPPASTQTSYVVKTGASHSINAARIIITQSSSSLSSSESQIEIGNQETGKGNTTAAALTSPKYWLYTAANWDATTSFSAEVTKAQSGTNFTTTFTLQQDDGAFGTWTDVATIVNADATTAATRFRVSFTPTTGRNYRISAVESSSSAGKNYSVYNAKIIIDQSGTISHMEPQYLVRNTVASTTGLQGFPTLWDSTEWANTSSTTFKNVIDSTNASSSAKLQDIDNSNTDVTNSTATGNNQVFSSAMTMPTSGHQVDANIIASATTLTADRIIAVVSMGASNSAPNAPTLSTPTSGATGVSINPSFTLSTIDPDSDAVKYRIYLYQSDCSTAISGSPFAQATTGTGWDNGSTAYASGATATYTYQGTLSINTTYCWQADAIDPGGTNTYGSTSATQLFTTVTGAVKINGGVNIKGGTTLQ